MAAHRLRHTLLPCKGMAWGVSFGRGGGEVSRFAVVALQWSCAAWLLTEYVGSLTILYGPSMLPSLEEEGNVCVLEGRRLVRARDWAGIGRPVGAGDVVVCRSPTTWRPGAFERVAKRVAAGPGDVVSFVDAAECRHCRSVRTRLASGERGDPVPRDGDGTKIYERKRLVVPPGHVWLAGDNPAKSTDSRAYGAVPLALVEGRVAWTIWPHWGPIPSLPAGAHGNSPAVSVMKDTI